MSAKNASVAVVGAGLAGLSAARALVERGHEVVVFDKGRGPGGRTSSRRAEPFAFDHGAQYFTARDPRFLRDLDGWLDAGVVARWEGRIAALGEGRNPRPSEGTERFVGAPRMSALAKHLARGLDLRCRTRVASLERLPQGWRLGAEDGADLGAFSRLVVTIPPAQAAELIGELSPLGQRAAGVLLRPCWAVLLGLEAPYPVPFDGAFCEGGALAWVARNNSKPGRPLAEAWVLHATGAWTEAHLRTAREDVAAVLAAELERLTGVPLPAAAHVDAHLWGYAQPDAPFEGQLPWDREARLVLAGDGYTGGRVEGAYLSGLAAAERLR